MQTGSVDKLEAHRCRRAQFLASAVSFLSGKAVSFSFRQAPNSYIFLPKCTLCRKPECRLVNDTWHVDAFLSVISESQLRLEDTHRVGFNHQSRCMSATALVPSR